jgi:ADP-heptose:LPS heptosyltransferase
MKSLALLPRGGLGDVLYHALFARYIQSQSSNFEPVLIAPRYAAFLADLLAVRHVPACSLLTDASAGLSLRAEIDFSGALYKLRGNCLASFTSDVIDHGLARCFRLSLFDEGTLGNWLYPFQNKAAAANPRHLVDRQRYALRRIGLAGNLPEAYRDIWRTAVAELQGQTDSRLLLFFPETAQTARNLTPGQMEYMITRLESEYRICIFTRYPERYRKFGVETAGFGDRLDPIRRILRAGAVISADTFSAHLAGITGTPTCVICNYALRPVWCQYWGSPYANVFNFENGISYQLDDQFQAFPALEDTRLFSTVGNASEQSLHSDTQSASAATLTGSAARS